MTIIKKVLSAFLAVLMIASLAVSAFAIDWEIEGSKLEITYKAGDGNGKTTTKKYSLEDSGDTEIPLISGSGYTHDDEDYEFYGWKIGSKTYTGDYFTFNRKNYTVDSDGTYYLTATAQYRDTTKSSSSSSTSGEKIKGKYYAGFAKKGKSEEYFTESYTKNKAFELPDCPYTRDNYKFDGWEIDGDVIGAGVKVKSDENFTAKATWKKIGIVVGDDTSSSSSSTGSKTSSSSSSTPSTSSSSVPASTSSSSVPASTSSSSAPSKSSSSVPSKSSSSVPASTSSETSSEPEPIEEPEQPVIEEFKPITIAYSISGDIPVNSVEFVLNEDIGAIPELGAVPLDSYSNTDPVTASLISAGDVLAAFDLTLSAGAAIYEGEFDGTVTYGLNGTQASAVSNYKEYVCAMVHVTDLEKFSGSSYYMLDGKQTCLYDVATGNKSEVGNITLVEKDGVCRAVIADVDSLSKFAYLASPEKIVEVVLMPDKNAESVSMDVTSLSPVMLIHMEMGKGGKAGGGIPGWVWIIIAALVVLIVVAVVFLVLKNRKPSYKAYTDETVSVPEPTSAGVSAAVTGLDDDEN